MQARPHPSPVHRRPQPDANAARAHWRALAADARRMAMASADGGGGWVLPIGFSHRLTRAPEFPTDRQAFASAIAKAFRAAADAMLIAATPERRAIAAPPLAALAEAVDETLDELIAPYVAHSLRRAGVEDRD